MAQVQALFQTLNDLREAAHALQQHGLPEDTLQVTYGNVNAIPQGSQNYDPIGGTRFAGSPIQTMAATGGNMVGNSVTMDLSLDMLPNLLESVAKIERGDGEEPYQPVYLLLVDYEGAPEAAESIRDVLQKHNGQTP